MNRIIATFLLTQILKLVLCSVGKYALLIKHGSGQVRAYRIDIADKALFKLEDRDILMVKANDCIKNWDETTLPSWISFDEDLQLLVAYTNQLVNEIETRIQRLGICSHFVIQVLSPQHRVIRKRNIEIFLKVPLPQYFLYLRKIREKQLLTTYKVNRNSCSGSNVFGKVTENVLHLRDVTLHVVRGIMFKIRGIVRGFKICSPMKGLKIGHGLRKRRNVPSSNCGKNSQLVALSQNLSKTIALNGFDHIRIGENLFKFHETNGPLTLNLRRKTTSEPVSSNSWFYYNAGLNLALMWTTYNIYLKQPKDGYQFTLTASDRCNNTASLDYFVRINNTNEKPPCYGYVVLLYTTMDTKTPFIYVVTDLVHILSTLNGFSMKDHLIQDVQRASFDENGTIYLLIFSQRTMPCQPCDVHRIMRKAAEFAKNRTFQESFSQNFRYLGVTVKWDTCLGTSPPIVLTPSYNLTMSKTGSMVFKIPRSTFYDAEDGFTSNLKLKIINQLDEKTLVVFMQSLNVYIFQLNVSTAPINSKGASTGVIVEARDNSQLTARTLLYIQKNHKRMRPLAEFSFEFRTYYEDWAKDQDILKRLLLLFSDYLDLKVGFDSFIVQSFIRKEKYPQSIQFSFAMHEFFEEQGLTMFLDIKRKFFYNGLISSSFSAFTIEYMRDIKGTFRDEFKDVPLPTFKSTVISSTYNTMTNTRIFPTKTFPTTPSGISKNGPFPRFTIGPFLTNFCDFFTFPIPKDLFYDNEDGYTRQLRLSIRDIEGKALGKNSWIQLDTNIQVLYGFLTIEDYEKIRQNYVEYNLIATNSRGFSNALQFRVNLPESVPRIYYTVTMHVNSFYDDSVPVINEKLLLLTKISSYFQSPSKFSWINIISFNKNKRDNTVKMAWTNCSLTNISCPLDDVRALESQIIINKNSPNSQFARSLSPHYVLNAIQAEKNEYCQSASSTPSATPSSSFAIDNVYPQLKNPIDVLRISTSSFFRYKIPNETFYDPKDGYTPYLMLSMVDMHGAPLSKSSWIQFNSLAQEIYGMLFVNTMNGLLTRDFQFVLIAVNSQNRACHHKFIVRVTRHAIPLGGSNVMIKGNEYLSDEMNEVQVAIFIMQRFFQYMGQSFKTEVQSFTKRTKSSFDITFVYNLMSPSLYCNQTQFRRLYGKLKDSGDQINTQLLISFLSEVTITSLSVETFGFCSSSPPTLPPTTSTTTVSRINTNKQIPMLNISNNQIFRYKIPEDTFTAGTLTTKDFTLLLLDYNKDTMKKDSWINLSTSKQEIIAVLTSKSITKTSQQVQQFFVRAMYNGDFADMKITAHLTIVDSLGFLNITVSGNQLFPLDSDNVVISEYFYQRFQSYLYPSTSGHNKPLIIHSIHHSLPPSTLFSITVFDPNINISACKNGASIELISKLYTSQKLMNPRLILYLYPSISVSRVQTSSLCDIAKTSTPPTTTKQPGPIVNIPIQPIQVFYGRILFEYINSKTFVDGSLDTNHLDLKLLSSRGNVLSSNSWLQLNKNAKLIYGILTLEEYNKQQTVDIFMYQLRATNDHGLFATTPVRLIPPKGSFHYGFKLQLTMSTYYDLSSPISNELLLFVTKMNKLLSDNVQSGIQVISFKRQSVVMRIFTEWTVDGQRESECYVSLFRSISKKLTVNGNPSKALIDTLAPEYVVFSVKVVPEKVCQSISTTPLTSTTTSTSTIATLPPILNANISTLHPQLCSVFIYYMPNRMFINPSDGTTNGIHLEFHTKDGEKVSSISWILYNSRYNYIYGMLTDEVIRNNKNKNGQLVYKLQAQNSGGVTSVDLVIKLPRLSETSHYIYMLFSTSSFITNLADVALLLVGKINMFLQVANVVSLNSLKKDLNKPQNHWSANFSICTIKYCNQKDMELLRAKLFTSQNVVQTSFSNSMYPELNVLQMNLVLTSCFKPIPITTTTTSATTTSNPSNNVPPMVLKVIPELEVSYCQMFHYTLEENAFFDVEDGLTRNLKLKLFTKDDKELPKDSWLVFHSKLQVLKGVLTSSDILYHSKESVYKLVATDKEGLTAFQYITITLQPLSKVDQGYNVESKGIIYSGMRGQSLKMFVYDKLYDFITKHSSWTGIRLYTIITYQEQQLMKINIKWSVCGISCKQSDLQNLKSLITEKDKVTLTFSTLFEPIIIITSSTVSSRSICPITPDPQTSTMSTLTTSTTNTPNTPPIIYKPIHALPIKRCSSFSFPIPYNTCFDKEDGFTPQLKLTLSYENRTSVGDKSWIYLNKVTQTLKGIIKTEDVIKSINGVFTFLLICEDREKLTVSQRIHLFTQITPYTPRYSLTMKSYIYVNESQTDVDIQIKWIHKLKEYMNVTETSDNVQIQNFDKSTIHYPQIVIKWYNCSINDPCSDEAKWLKNELLNVKNHHSMNTRFFRSMVPEFVMISGSFRTNENCSPTTTTASTSSKPTTSLSNQAPISIVKILNVVVKICKETIYQIPSNTFFDPEDGYTPGLTLVMKKMNGREIDIKTCFICFDNQTQTVRARYIRNILPLYSIYILYAYDSQRAWASSQVSFIVEQEKPRISHSFRAFFHWYEMPKQNLIILNKFAEKMKNFYEDKRQDVLFSSIQIEPTYMEIEWVNCSLASVCPLDLLKPMISKIFVYDQILNSNLIAELAPEFIIRNVTFNYFPCDSTTTSATTVTTKATTLTTKIPVSTTSPKNTNPSVNVPILQLNIPLCSPFSYRIPEDTFYDKEDGNTRNLKLSLSQYNGQQIPKTSWVQFVGETQVIYGQIRSYEIVSSDQLIKFILTAFDSDGLSNSTTVSLIIPQEKEVSYYLEAIFSRFFDANTPYLTPQLFLISKIASYASDNDVTKVMTIFMSRFGDTVILRWTNCTLSAQCDNVLIRENLALFTDGQRRVSAGFEQALHPFYTIKSIKSVISQTCTTVLPQKSTTNTLQTTSPSKNNPPFVTRPIPPILVTLCSSFSYYIPKDTFSDEDGDTSKLSLQLLEFTGKPVSKTSWLQLKNDTHLIYGLIKATDVQKQPVNGFRFILKAFDKQGQSTSLVLSFTKVFDTAFTAFKVFMEVECSTGTYPYVDEAFVIINAISKYFNNQKIQTVKTIDISEIRPRVLLFSWTNCTLDFSVCPSAEIKEMREKLSDIKMFQQYMKESYRLLNVYYSYSTPCQEPTTTPATSSPVILNIIPTIIVKQCSHLYFQIPNNTFYDAEDANLILRVTFINNTNLPENFWLQYNPECETLEGFPAKLQNISAPYHTNLFTLTARNKYGQEAFMIVRIDVLPSQQQGSKMLQNFTLTLRENFPVTRDSNQSIVESLFKRISSYYGDTGNYFIRLIDFKNVNKKIVLEWMNCSMIGDSCNTSLASHLQSKIADISGRCRSEFAFVFLPEYTVYDLSLSNDYTCGDSLNTTSTTIITTRPLLPTPPNTIRLLRNITVKIKSYCSQVLYEIPEHIFYDNKDGNSREFDYELFFSDRKKITCSSWLQYDNTTMNNVLYGNVLLDQHISPKIFLLQAKNNVGSTAFSHVSIDTSDLVTNSSVAFKVAMSFKTILPSQTCDAEILRILRQKLSTYFEDHTDDFLNFLFFSRGDSSGQPSYVAWTNCSIRTDVCDYVRINYIISRLRYENGTVVPSFIEKMAPEFINLSVLDEKIGPCSRRKVLAVGSGFETICVKSCGLFTYQITKEFFKVINDFYMDDVIVEVTNEDKTPLTKDSWVYFDQKNKILKGFPTEKVIENQPYGGYSYIIFAYNFIGDVESNTITFKFCNGTPSHTKSIYMEFECSENITKSAEVAAGPLNAISHLYFEDSLSRIFVTRINSTAKQLILAWTNCTGPLKSELISFEKITEELSNSSCNQLKNNKDTPPTVTEQRLRFKISLCTENKFKIPVHVIQDKEDGSLDKLVTYLTYPNKTKVGKKEWVSFNSTSLQVIAIPSNKTLINSIFEYYIVAKDSQNQMAHVSVLLEFFDTFPMLDHLISVSFISATKSRVIQSIASFIEKIADFLQSNATMVLVVDYELRNDGVTTVLFGNCSLLDTLECPYDEKDAVMNHLLVNSEINPYLMRLLFPEFFVQEIKSVPIGKCLLERNHLPRVQLHILNVTMTECGIVRFDIPDETFYDLEDGFTRNLTLSLFTSAQQQCWLQFNATSQQILAIYTTEAFTQQPSEGYTIPLQATDSRGKSSNTTVNINFPARSKASFQLVILFKLKAAKLECFEERFTILDSLLSFFMDFKNLGIVRLSHGLNNKIAEVVLKNCSLRFNPCDFATIDLMTSQLKTSNGIQKEFIEFMNNTGSYVPRYISQEKDTICLDRSNTKPYLNSSFADNITITSCPNTSHAIPIPDRLVYDKEDGVWSNMKVELINASSGFQIGNASWIYLNIEQKTLDIFWTSQYASIQMYDGYKFTIRVTDSRESSVSIPFKVFLLQHKRNTTFLVDTLMPWKETLPTTMITWLNKTSEVLGRNATITSYKLTTKKTVSVRWTVCSNENPPECDFALLRSIEKYHVQNNLTKFTINKYGVCLRKEPFLNATNITHNVDSCQKFYFKIPNHMFVDANYGGTRNLTIEALQIHPTETADFIRYNQTSQTFVGLVRLDFFEEHSFVVYNLTATNIQGQHVSALLRLVLNTKKYVRQFEFEINVIRYKVVTDEQRFVENFCRKLETYLQSVNSKGIMLYSWRKVSGNRLPKYNIIFTPCELTGVKCSLSEIKDITDALMSSTTNGVNARLVKTLLYDIAAENITMRNLTECQPLKINKAIKKIQINICGDNQFKIPTDTFTTTAKKPVNISIMVENIFHFGWITYNKNTFTILFTPTLRELRNQPDGGYNITIVAATETGYQVKFNTTVIIQDDIKTFNFLVTICMTKQTKPLNLGSKVGSSFIRESETKLNAVFIDTQFKVKLLDYQQDDNTLNMTLYDCQLNKDFCQNVQNNMFLNFVRNAMSEISTIFMPNYTVLNVKRVISGKCLTIPLDRPYVTDTIPMLNMTLCKRLRYILPKGFFIDDIDGDLTPAAELYLVNNLQNKDNPIFYDQKSQIILGFITHSSLEKFTTKTLFYQFKATNSRGISTSIPITIHLPEQTSFNLLVTTTAKTYINYESDVQYMIDICNRISNYFNASLENKISFINLTTVTKQGNAGLTDIKFVWTNCNFLGNSCNKKQLNSFLAKIVSNKRLKKPKNEFSEALGENRGFIVEKISTEIENCLHPGDREGPVALRNVTLNITTCGYFEYLLKKDIFTDENKGDIWNLKLSLTFLNSSNLDETYWLYYNDTEKKISGMPPSFNTTEDSSLFAFLIHATDNDNKSSYTHLYIHVENTVHVELERSYSVETMIECQKSDENSADIKTIIRVLNATTDISDTHLITFRKNQSTLFAYWMNCNDTFIQIYNKTTVRNCITRQRKIPPMLKSTTATAITTTTATHTTTATTITNSTKNTISQNRPPQVINSITELVIRCGKPTVKQIPENTFYDSEDGTTSNLTLQLLDSRDIKVRRSTDNPVILSNLSREIVGFVSTEECFGVEIDSFYKVQATDSAGETVTSTFKTRKIAQSVSCCVYVILELNSTLSTVEEVNNVIKTLQTEVYNKGNVELAVMTWNIKQDGQTVLKYTDLHITNETCTQNKTKMLISSTIDTASPENNRVTTNFTNAIDIRYKINNVTVEKDPSCNKTASPIPFVPPPEASVGEFITSRDWFLYLLPLFILAFMLLMCCLCYYCCRYCVRTCIGPAPQKLPVDVFDKAPGAYSSIPLEQVSPEPSINDNIAAKPRWDDVELPIESKVAKTQFEAPISVTELDYIDSFSDKRKNQFSDSKIKSSLANDLNTFDTSRMNITGKTVDIPSSYTKPPQRRRHLPDLQSPSYRQQEHLSATYRQQDNNTSLKATTSHLSRTDPITTSYRTTARHSVHTEEEATDRKRRTLRLPALPKEPPPPYSPPRRHRIFRQNILPAYYERYSLRRGLKAKSPILVPYSSMHHKQAVILSPKIKRLVPLPTRRRKRVLTPVLTIPDDDSITTSDNSIEMKAIIKGKERTLKQLLHAPLETRRKSRRRKSATIVGAEKCVVESKKKRKSSSGTRFKYKLSKPLIYDYIPVRRTKRARKYKLSGSNKQQYEQEKQARLPKTLDELLEESLDDDDNNSL